MIGINKACRSDLFIFAIDSDDMMTPIIFLYFLRFCQCNMPEVKYVVNLDSQMEICEDDVSAGFVDTSLVTVERFNETVAYMYGDIIFLKDFSANTMISVVLMKEASGKFEVMFSHEICDMCGEIEKAGESDYHPYMKFFGLPASCPFGSNTYHIEDMVVDTDDLPVNSNTVGRYKALMSFYDNPEQDCKTKSLMACLTLYFIIEAD